MTQPLIPPGSCSPRFACQIAGALLMSPPFEAVNEEALDGVAEVANMIVGNVKTFLEERLGSMALSIPTVVFGRNSKLVRPESCIGTLSHSVVGTPLGGPPEITEPPFSRRSRCETKVISAAPHPLAFSVRSRRAFARGIRPGLRDAARSPAHPG